MASMAAANAISSGSLGSLGRNVSAVHFASGSVSGASAAVHCRDLRSLGLVAAPRVRLISPVFVVRADNEGRDIVDAVRNAAAKAVNFVTGLASETQGNVATAAETVRIQADEVGDKARSSSEDLGNEVKNLKDNVQVEAEGAGEELKRGVGEASSQAQDAGEDVTNKAKCGLRDAEQRAEDVATDLKQ